MSSRANCLWSSERAKPKSPKVQAQESFRAKYNVDLQTTTAHNAGRDAAENAQNAFGQVGKVIKDASGKTKRVTTDMVVAALRHGAPGVTKTSPLWIRVGLELARGGLTPGTAARLHKAGYSVGQLGFKMRPAAGAPANTRPTRPAGGSNRATV